MTIDVPKLIVQDGYGASVFDTVEKPVVVGNESDGPITPVTRTLTTGTKVDVMVYGNGKEKAVVDISVEFSGKAAAPAKKGRVQWRALRERVIDCVKLGRPISASFEGFDLQFVVNEVCSDE
jgi:hypothetical protein